MANQWLRLWHDMPTDPKWKTIARVSGQPISLVQAVYIHLLVDASRNVTRGHVTVTHEDLASALDVTEQAISDVLAAMKGRVLDGDKLSGWDKRQVKREEGVEGESSAKSAAQRKREQRERDRESQGVTQSHEVSRNVTLDKDKEEEKEKINTVFAHWRGVMGKTRATLTDDRETKIRARLRDGYSVEDLCAAIDGCASSRYHMGDNPDRKTYNEIDLIFRNGGNVEKFRDSAASGAQQSFQDVVSI